MTRCPALEKWEWNLFRKDAQDVCILYCKCPLGKNKGNDEMNCKNLTAEQAESVKRLLGWVK